MSKQEKTQNDYAWESIFEKYDVINRIKEEGRFIISSNQIKAFREPRLMAKFDHSINLPQIFSNNNLSILPISRGSYVISHFEAYHGFDELDKTIVHAQLPDNLQSLDSSNITSESIAINCALASGIIADFLEEEELYATVSGRMGSGQFNYRINNTYTGYEELISVNNSQIEIDAAFEGVHSLSLIEAKRDLSEDFLVRQMYYPYRVWSQRVTKKVRPVFLVYSNGVFSLYEYEFCNPDSYNSLVLVKHRNYSIEDTAIELQDIIEAVSSSRVMPEPRISFPQANSFDRIVNICELLNTRDLSREEVTQEYAFDIRQTNYYTDAARYLGLLEKQYGDGRKPFYSLSGKGKRIMGLHYKQRQLALCQAICEHRVFHEVFQHCMKSGGVPDNPTIVSIMEKSNIYKVKSESTYIRRASTISRWMNWMLDLVNE